MCGHSVGLCFSNVSIGGMLTEKAGKETGR